MIKLYQFLKYRCHYFFLRYWRYRKSHRFLFVNSSSTEASDGIFGGYSWKKPFITLNQACYLALPHTVIFIGPGHQEIITAEVAVDSCLIPAFVTIHGIGSKENRPVFNGTGEKCALKY